MGAQDFAEERISECFATTDNCYQLGLGAAAAVSGLYCSSNQLFQREWLPRKCKQIRSKSSCNTHFSYDLTFLLLSNHSV